MTKSTRFKPTFIREWRQNREMSLDALASRIPMDKSNLSKVERGILPYNQPMLEQIALALQTDPASLLARDPTEPTAIWSIMARAKPAVRRQIEEVAATLVRTEV